MRTKYYINGSIVICAGIWLHSSFDVLFYFTDMVPANIDN